MARWLSVLLGCAAATAVHGTGYPAFYPADADRGKTLADGCLACHGSDGMMAGNLSFHVPRLGGQRPISIFEALLEYQNGARKSALMTPLVAALSLQDVRDLAAYLAGPKPILSADPLPDSMGHAKVHSDCAACHGETGLSVMPGYPVLGGQYEDYLVHALTEYKSGARQNRTMHGMAIKLSEDEIREVARYFAERNYLRTAR